MYLLDKSELKPNARKDPVVISRVMSALVGASIHTLSPIGVFQIMEKKTVKPFPSDEFVP